ncbi:DNA uptake lipoprotein [Paenibacillus marinisediminis]
MQLPKLRGLRLIVIGGLLGVIFVSCASVKDQTPPISTSTALSPQSELPQSEQSKSNKPKSDQMSISSDQASEGQQSNNPEPAEYPFDRNDIRLKSISLTNSADEVTTIWGDPLSKITMDDNEPIQVLEYDGFSIGCDRTGHVAFVEVSGDGVSTGFQGLKIGDMDYNARAALGNPDEDSGYVWRYIEDDVLLRLDLDPKTSIVQSVKLFPYEQKSVYTS